jgi:hypothetical protein
VAAVPVVVLAVEVAAIGSAPRIPDFVAISSLEVSGVDDEIGGSPTC